jgi:hypothetical protein
MARTYRDIAIEEMLGTVEEAMSQVIGWWGDLPPPMKEAIEQFRTQLGRAARRLYPSARDVRNVRSPFMPRQRSRMALADP